MANYQIIDSSLNYFYGQLHNNINRKYIEIIRYINNYNQPGKSLKHDYIVSRCNYSKLKNNKGILFEIHVFGYLYDDKDGFVWKQYNSGRRRFNNVILKDGLKKNSKLDTPIIVILFDNLEKHMVVHDSILVQKRVINGGNLMFLKNFFINFYNRIQHIVRDMVCANIKFSVSNDTNNSLMLLTNNLSLDSVFFNDESFENSMDDLVLLNDKICGKVEVHSNYSFNTFKRLHKNIL